MNKFLKRAIIFLASLAILLLIAYQGLIAYTKSFSPEQTATFQDGELEIEITYSSPSKKNREIFGNLVPFGKVWRTGANEATIFTTTQDLNFGGKTLPKGEYTLFSIPGPDSWEIIFNSEQYDWGINYDGTSPHKPEADVLRAKASVLMSNGVKEQFGIYIDRVEGIVFEWDRTRAVLAFE